MSAPSKRSVPRRVCVKCGLKRPETSYAGERARVCNSCKREVRRKSARAKHLRETYGLTMDEDTELARVQGNVCAGCRGRRKYLLHVDHDHALERTLLAKGLAPAEAARLSVRGKLCARCNKVLRDVRDDADVLMYLVGYLRNPPARKVLK